jgi:antitoxin (DNA-binding transcriptional repressor) of toxin-antitoxin stability system
LSRLIDLVYHGETITITKNNLPIVDMVPHRVRTRRQLGTLAGQITVPDDFDQEDPDIPAVFYGESS